MQPWREKLAEYWDRAGRGPLRATVALVLDGFMADGRAAPLRVVDLGCGVGRDTLPLLAQGHQVQAIDREEEAVRRLRSACPPQDLARLAATVGSFQDVEWSRVDLTVSSFALPFCPPERFAGLWRAIEARSVPGGRIACQLLGRNDDFATRAGVTAHNPEDITALASGFRLEHLEEEETDTITPRGRRKHWHLFHLVLKKT